MLLTTMFFHSAPCRPYKVGSRGYHASLRHTGVKEGEDSCGRGGSVNTVVLLLARVEEAAGYRIARIKYCLVIFNPLYTFDS